MVYLLTASNAVDDVRDFLDALGNSKHRDGFSDCFGGCVAEDSLCSPIPAPDNPV
jgi:hypothetical protein